MESRVTLDGIIIKDIGLKDTKCQINTYRTLRHPFILSADCEQGRIAGQHLLPAAVSDTVTAACAPIQRRCDDSAHVFCLCPDDGFEK